MFCRLAYTFCSKVSKVPPPPQHPTLAGSFATKIEKKDLEKFMNPLGFLSEKELEDYKKEVEVLKGQKYVHEPGTMPKEVGYKVKGLEPTRYGDWQGSGRLTDF